MIKISDNEDDDPVLDLALHLSKNQGDSRRQANCVDPRESEVPLEYVEEEISSSPL